MVPGTRKSTGVNSVDGVVVVSSGFGQANVGSGFGRSSGGHASFGEAFVLGIQRFRWQYCRSCRDCGSMAADASGLLAARAPEFPAEWFALRSLEVGELHVVCQPDGLRPSVEGASSAARAPETPESSEGTADIGDVIGRFRRLKEAYGEMGVDRRPPLQGARSDFGMAASAGIVLRGLAPSRFNGPNGNGATVGLLTQRWTCLMGRSRTGHWVNGEKRKYGGGSMEVPSRRCRPGRFRRGPGRGE